jgi:hypothetical protein
MPITEKPQTARVRITAKGVRVNAEIDTRGLTESEGTYVAAMLADDVMIAISQLPFRNGTPISKQRAKFSQTGSGR